MKVIKAMLLFCATITVVAALRINQPTDFAVNSNKAEVWRAPATEMGFSTIVGVPVAYSYWKQGRISEVQSCGYNLQAFYWFAKHTYVGSCDAWKSAPGGYTPECWGFPCEIDANLHSQYDQGENHKAIKDRYYDDQNIFQRVSGFNKKTIMGNRDSSSVPKNWEAAPTKEHFAAMKDLPGSKAPMKAKYSIVISNKDKHEREINAETQVKFAKVDDSNGEGWQDIGNYFSVELKKMLDGVQQSCPDTQIVYVRNRNIEKGKKESNATAAQEDADYQLMKQYSNVVTMEDVVNGSPDVDFNEKQLRVLAKNNCFMSPRGGFQQMSASVAGGKHIVKQVVGTERSGFYKRQREQWNATVTLTRSTDDFLNAFQQEILAGGCQMCVLQE